MAVFAGSRTSGRSNLDVAVRSSATAEDLPEASFAGQHESYLNVRGERALLDACLRCIASLFTDRAIFYRQTHGFDHMRVALSVGVQRMVRSDRVWRRFRVGSFYPAVALVPLGVILIGPEDPGAVLWAQRSPREGPNGSARHT